jgi:hypothetical protein
MAGSGSDALSVLPHDIFLENREVFAAGFAGSKSGVEGMSLRFPKLEALTEPGARDANARNRLIILYAFAKPTVSFPRRPKQRRKPRQGRALGS